MAGNPNDIVVQSCAICRAQFQVYASVREAVCPTCGATNQIGARPVVQKRPPMARPVVRPRVVLQTSTAQKAQSWLTLLMFAAMAGLGWGVYHFRDRLWPKSEGTLAAPGAVAEAVDIERPYQAARARLMDGNRERARETAKVFRELDGPGVAQPLRNWVTFHSGLAHLLAGENQQAIDRFQRLAERAEFSKAPADAKLVAFFQRSVALASADQAIPAAAVENLERKNYEAMGLLLAGLKNWALGAQDEAGAVLGEFAKAEPAGADEWVAEYKDIAKGFVDDLGAWRTANEAFTAAKDAPEKQAEALATIKAARERLTTKQFTGDLAKLETTLTETIANMKAEQAKMMSEREVADVALLAELKKKTDALCGEIHFTEALKAALEAKVETPKRKAELEVLQKRMGWLARFKRNVILDLAALGYRGGVTKRDGKPVPGEVRAADEMQVATVPWSEVSPDWLVKVATAFIDANSRLDYKSDRQFDLGVFLLQQGRTKDADEWMTKAGDIKYEYKEAVMLLLDGPPAP